MNDVTGMGREGRFFVIAGPCVIEGPEFLLETAREIKRIAESSGVDVVFKASFDKANRSSVSGFRGPGLTSGLAALEAVKGDTGLPVLTDVHETSQVAEAAKVADVLQVPAFLARQTDLLAAAARYARVVNVKKGQFMAPWEMVNAVEKIRSAGKAAVWLTERGTTFGYNNLVVDFRGIGEMRKTLCPVVFDGTHSLQLPAAQGKSSGGTREHVEPLARAAVAAGVDGLFLEVHPDPPRALSDAATQISFETFGRILREALAIRKALSGLAEGS